MGTNLVRALHREQAHHLQQMVLDDISDDSILKGAKKRDQLETRQTDATNLIVRMQNLPDQSTRHVPQYQMAP